MSVFSDRHRKLTRRGLTLVQAMNAPTQDEADILLGDDKGFCCRLHAIETAVGTGNIAVRILREYANAGHDPEELLRRIALEVEA